MSRRNIQQSRSSVSSPADKPSAAAFPNREASLTSPIQTLAALAGLHAGGLVLLLGSVARGEYAVVGAFFISILQETYRMTIEAQATAALCGVIRKLLPAKGYGFITANNQDYFFYYNAHPKQRPLKEQMDVEFLPIDKTELRKSKPRALDLATRIRPVRKAAIAA